MGSGSIWEVKLLRIACAICFLIFTYTLFNALRFSLSDDWLNLFQDGLVSKFSTYLHMGSMFTIALMAFVIFFVLTPNSYPIILAIFIIGFHLLANLMTFAADFDSYFLKPDEQIGMGRWMDTAFRNFPLISVGALIFTRLWAFTLWILLSMLIPFRIVHQILYHPLTYFESEWNAIVSDGFAINSWIFKDNITLQIFFVVVLIGIYFFNQQLLKSTLQAEKSNVALGRYFSPEIKQEIVSSDSNLAKQKPKDMDIAVMFTDIVSFTKLSEKMDPKDVLKLLSDYQTMMVDAIFEYKGSVDKFIGDAVMANFGTPKSHGNDAQNAFDCALLMNVKLSEWNKVRKAAGLSMLEHRIGIHFGPCVVGNMGSEQRVEFAVIGDAVNVASRICDACKEFDTNFLISADLADKITHNQHSEIVSDYKIRGRSEPIDLVKIYIDQ